MLNAQAEFAASSRFREYEQKLETLFRKNLEDEERDWFLRLTDTEWKPLLICAVLHNLEGMLPSLAEAQGIRLQPLTQQYLQQQENRCKLLWLRLQEALFELMTAFEKAGIQVVCLKGPVLAERIYAVPTTRISTDLDFLIAPEQFPQASACLSDLGYRISGTAPQNLPQGAQKSLHELGFERPKSVPVELHFNAHEGFGTPLPALDVMQRAIPYQTVGSLKTLIPAPEDEFLFLAVHAAGHRVARLSWLLDLRFFLTRHPSLDLEMVVRRAHQYRVTSALQFALTQCQQRLQFALPPYLAQFLPGSPLRGWALEKLALNLPKDTPRRPLHHLGTTLFAACLHDTFPTGFRFLSRQATDALHRRLTPKNSPT
ncbi:MAG: nucleotidyltransferase family protein [Blastocatellia bacterium]|nr:nucleotidyltransferase family protein [Blastocatellia bacterium]